MEQMMYRVRWGTHSRPDTAGVLHTYRKGEELALTPEQASKLGDQVEVVGDFVPRTPPAAAQTATAGKPVVNLPPMAPQRGRRGSRGVTLDAEKKQALDPTGVRDVIPGVQEGDVLVMDANAGGEED